MACKEERVRINHISLERQGGLVQGALTHSCKMRTHRQGRAGELHRRGSDWPQAQTHPCSPVDQLLWGPAHPGESCVDQEGERGSLDFSAGSQEMGTQKGDLD